MTSKRTLVLLETDFTNKVNITTSKEFSTNTIEDKIAELTKMYKAGKNIQRLLNDKDSGLTPEEINQYRGRVLTGFKKLNTIIKTISSEIGVEEDAVKLIQNKAK